MLTAVNLKKQRWEQKLNQRIKTSLRIKKLQQWKDFKNWIIYYWFICSTAVHLELIPYLFIAIFVFGRKIMKLILLY